MSFDLDADRIRALLDELDRRLKAGEVAATLYIVGGAAISLSLPGSDRRTQDVDGITDDDRVAEHAAAMAGELGLPENWLNDSARAYIPSVPERGSTRPPAPGLHIELAPLEHLLAMKLAAGRARDRVDIRALADALGVTAEQAVQITIDVYGVDYLETITSVEDVTLDAHAIIGSQ
ncbi:MAG: DUF6036 family nucleotidyltransferase [Dermatophilaceae bacterium]